MEEEGRVWEETELPGTVDFHWIEEGEICRAPTDLP